MRVFLENRLKAHKARVARYIADDEDGGTTTIEFVLWLPIFILILSLVIDVCFVFLGQAVMYDVASDSARRASIGQDLGVTGGGATSTESDCSAAATDLYETTCENATFLGAKPTVDIVEQNGAFIVTIKHNLADIDVVGVLGFVSTTKITAVVTQLKEGS